jgi:cold-inducible RNA-binding protein
MNRKLYVTNIPWSVTNDDLKAWLVDRGFVVDEVKIILSKEDGRSRGFGFVTFRTDADLDRALTELEGALYLKRPLHVAEAMQKRGGGHKRSPERSFDEPHDAPRRGHRGRERGDYDRD